MKLVLSHKNSNYKFCHQFYILGNWIIERLHVSVIWTEGAFVDGREKRHSYEQRGQTNVTRIDQLVQSLILIFFFGSGSWRGTFSIRIHQPHLPETKVIQSYHWSIGTEKVWTGFYSPKLPKWNFVLNLAGPVKLTIVFVALSDWLEYGHWNSSRRRNYQFFNGG